MASIYLTNLMITKVCRKRYSSEAVISDRVIEDKSIWRPGLGRRVFLVDLTARTCTTCRCFQDNNIPNYGHALALVHAVELKDCMPSYLSRTSWIAAYLDDTYTSCGYRRYPPREFTAYGTSSR